MWSERSWLKDVFTDCTPKTRPYQLWYGRLVSPTLTDYFQQLHHTAPNSSELEAWNSRETSLIRRKPYLWHQTTLNRQKYEHHKQNRYKFFQVSYFLICERYPSVSALNFWKKKITHQCMKEYMNHIFKTFSNCLSQLKTPFKSCNIFINLCREL